MYIQHEYEIDLLFFQVSMFYGLFYFLFVYGFIHCYYCVNM